MTRGERVSVGLSVVAVVAGLGMLLTLAMRPQPDGLPPVAGAGIHVVDGDTVDWQGRRWRLTGYDTPEIYHAGCPAERHRGIVAAARLVALIEAGAVLEPAPPIVRAPSGEDVNRQAPIKLDKWGRGLGRLVLDGADVGETLIREGHARAYDGRTARQSWCD